MAESVLPNGVRVLTERIPGVRSVSVGAWVRQGAAHETRETMGASHLLEHMVFKGTRRRSAREIALALEGLGGSLDAYTSREHTSYQARVLDEHMGVALDVLSDLVLAPSLKDEDLALEREVVLEEIATVEDTPDDLVFDLHGEQLWGDHPYGHTILGTRETVRGMSPDTLREIHGKRYTGRNLVVAAAGNLEHQDVVGRVEDLFGEVEAGEPAPRLGVPGSLPSGSLHQERASAQTHLVFGGGIPGHSDPRRYALAVISSALGGGMSSRLFQRVREELGLAYAVFTFQSFYSRAGISGVYVGTRPATAGKAAEAVREELQRLSGESLPEEELNQTKQQLKGQIMLSLESTGSRLYRLAGFALHEEPFLTLDEVLKKLDAVTAEEVSEAARDFFDPERLLLLSLGPSS
jgi:predicted Zn-dependent peptidase